MTALRERAKTDGAFYGDVPDTLPGRRVKGKRVKNPARSRHCDRGAYRAREVILLFHQKEPLSDREGLRDAHTRIFFGQRPKKRRVQIRKSGNLPSCWYRLTAFGLPTAGKPDHEVLIVLFSDFSAKKAFYGEVCLQCLRHRSGAYYFITASFHTFQPIERI